MLISVLKAILAAVILLVPPGCYGQNPKPISTLPSPTPALQGEPYTVINPQYDEKEIYWLKAEEKEKICTLENGFLLKVELFQPRAVSLFLWQGDLLIDHWSFHNKFKNSDTTWIFDGYETEAGIAEFGVRGELALHVRPNDNQIEIGLPLNVICIYSKYDTD